jgi:hypothetical protein
MMHARFRPEVRQDKCIACAACAEHCPTGAITVPEGGKALLAAEKCIGCGECAAHCPSGAIPVNWGDSRGLQERCVEFAAALLAAKPGRCGFLSLLTKITPNCDCMHDPGRPFVPDLGALAARDVVAIDQAALDLVGRSGSVAAAVPGTEIGLANELAEGLGLGSRRYQLVEVS